MYYQYTLVLSLFPPKKGGVSMKKGLYYLNDVPASIGENGEKLFRKGNRIAVPVVVSLPEKFKHSVLEQYRQFLN